MLDRLRQDIKKHWASWAGLSWFSLLLILLVAALITKNWFLAQRVMDIGVCSFVFVAGLLGVIKFEKWQEKHEKD